MFIELALGYHVAYSPLFDAVRALVGGVAVLFALMSLYLLARKRKNASLPGDRDWTIFAFIVEGTIAAQQFGQIGKQLVLPWLPLWAIATFFLGIGILRRARAVG